MLNEAGYPDKNLVRDICSGFRLIGWLEKSNVFPPAQKTPMHNVDAAQKLAKSVNHSIIKQVGAAADPDLEAEAWRQTEEGVAKGWTWFDKGCNPQKKLLAKRFGLHQGEKVRLIDDCTIGGFNGACGSSERLRVHAIDAWCLSNLQPNSLKEVVGKTYDLKNAYEQYGAHPEDSENLTLAVWNPDAKQVHYMGINALPFGAIGHRLCECIPPHLNDGLVFGSIWIEIVLASVF